MKTLSRKIGWMIPLLLMVHSPAPAGQLTAYSTQAELEALLAPVALYPDTLLAQILTASLYPMDVVLAGRWIRNNPYLEGEHAVRAVANRDWDPSVKALVAFPRILTRMSEELEWTQRLGNAVRQQEEQVLFAVQRLRGQAYAAGHLASSDYVRVVHQGPSILLEPVRTRIIHVPYYDPRVVYGVWPWSTCAPVIWPPPPGWGADGRRFRYVGVSVPSTVFVARFNWSQGYLVMQFGETIPFAPYPPPAVHRPPHYIRRQNSGIGASTLPSREPKSRWNSPVVPIPPTPEIRTGPRPPSMQTRDYRSSPIPQAGAPAVPPRTWPETHDRGSRGPLDRHRSEGGRPERESRRRQPAPDNPPDSSPSLSSSVGPRPGRFPEGPQSPAGPWEEEGRVFRPVRRHR